MESKKKEGKDECPSKEFGDGMKVTTGSWSKHLTAPQLSLGDARSYYLSTAKDELGVVYAKSRLSGEWERIPKATPNVKMKKIEKKIEKKIKNPCNDHCDDPLSITVLG